MSEQGIDSAAPGGDRTVLSVFGPSPLLSAWHNWHIGEAIDAARREMFALRATPRMGRSEEPTMTEAEWLASVDPAAMINFLLGQRESGVVGSPFLERVAGCTDRKLRLLIEASGCETCLRFLKDEPMHTIAEHAQYWAEADCGSRKEKADLLRHIIGNPFTPLLSRPCTACKGDGKLDADHRRGTVQCSLCWGKGWQPISPPTEECGRCDGAGWTIRKWHDDLGKCVGQFKEECEPCHGKGVLPSFPTLIVQLAEGVYAGEPCGPVLYDAILEAGIGDQPCEKCDGKGWYYDDSGGNIAVQKHCLECGSSGRRNKLAEHFSPTCLLCRGTGKLWYWGEGQCGKCSGTGEADNTHPRGCFAIDVLLSKE